MKIKTIVLFLENFIAACAIATISISTNALNLTISSVDDIQDAIDSVATAGGGKVILEPGKYTLNETILLTSNVSLEGKTGERTNTILTLPAGDNYAMITGDGSEPLENMAVKNMVIDGNIPESSVSHDPDGDFPQGDALGIFFNASFEETYHTNITIENIELHHLALGIHLKGVTGATIKNVYAHHNGIFYWPGHNMYFRRTNDISVQSSTVSDTFNGAGINISYSTNVEIRDTMSLRNQGRGFRAASTDGFLVHDSVIANNGDVGLLANFEGYNTTNIDWQNNCVANSGSAGIQAPSSAQGVSLNNNSYGNGSSDYSLPSGVLQSNNNDDPNIGCGEIIHMRKRNASSFAIDGNHDGDNAQNIYLWSQNSSNENQQWIEINRGDGYYSYQKANTNYCIDGDKGGENMQNVYLWLCTSANENQQWRKVNSGSGYHRLEKRNAPNYSIDGNWNGENGQNIYLYSSGSHNLNQQWLFTYQ